MAEDMMMDMSAYQKWEHGMIEDISHDTDALIKMLGDEKVGESYDSGLLAGMLSKQGIDPGIVAMLNQNAKDGTLGGDNGLLVLLFLIILLGGGNGLGGWGNGGGVDRTVINEGNFNQLMTAVTSTGQAQQNAIQSLANTLNTDTNAIQMALAGVDKQIAVNQGSITNAIQQCCCNIRTEMQSQSSALQLGLQRDLNVIENDIASQSALITSQFAQQNAVFTKMFCDQNSYLADQFCQIKNREDQREIQQLRDELAQARSTANTNAILSAIANKDTIAYTGNISGTTVTGTGSLS